MSEEPDRSGRGRSGWPAALVATVSGLGLLGASAAAWSVTERERDVGGVVVPEVIGTTGAELEPALLVAGLVVLVAAVALAVTRGPARRIVALVVAGAGVLAAVGAARAGLRAADLPGGVQPIVAVALLCALGAVVAGVLGARATGRTRLPARYDAPAEQPTPRSTGGAADEHGEQDEVDEWALAAEDDDA